MKRTPHVLKKNPKYTVVILPSHCSVTGFLIKLGTSQIQQLGDKKPLWHMQPVVRSQAGSTALFVHTGKERKDSDVQGEFSK